MVLADERLARQDVVAERHVIVFVLALRICEQLGSAAQGLEARLAGVRLAAGGFEEEMLGDVLREAQARDGVYAEVLDAELVRREAGLEVLGGELRDRHV